MLVNPGAAGPVAACASPTFCVAVASYADNTGVRRLALLTGAA